MPRELMTWTCLHHGVRNPLPSAMGRIAPDGLEQANWSWADERLGRLRELGIRPIVGLLHHGSGPHEPGDSDFPEKLTEFARAVAQLSVGGQLHPVNEPLTTARFSGLYGHWYPHGRDGPSPAPC